MTIWISEQIDGCGIIYSCIAFCDENKALDCYQSWLNSLTDEQKQQGWVIQLRTVNSWDDVPVSALKIS